MALAQYLAYVLRHKWFVFIECCHLGVPWRGLLHDLSKFLPSEFLPYARHFYGRPGPHAAADSGEEAFNLAWLKHQKRNKHHWQWWVLRFDDGTVRALEMPDEYRREMVADWRGAGKAQGKPDTRAWYEANRGKMVLGLETRAWVEQELGIPFLDTILDRITAARR